MHAMMVDTPATITWMVTPAGVAIAAMIGALWYWQRLKRRLALQKQREGQCWAFEAFLEQARLPRRARAVSRILVVGALLTILIATTVLFVIIADAAIFAFGLSFYLENPGLIDGAMTFLVVLWYGALHGAISLFQLYAKGQSIFANYHELVTHVRAARSSEEVLEFASSLMRAARMHVRGPSDVLRIWTAVQDPSDHTAYYGTHRLLEALAILEQRFPYASDDAGLRERFWACGRAIYGVLRERHSNLVKSSVFAKMSYPDTAFESKSPGASPPSGVEKSAQLTSSTLH